MIDFIITWVDGSDKDWLSNFKKFNYKEENDSNNKARYRDFGILKYILRGIDIYTPWVNKVHLITSGHKPEWINLNYDKLNFLTHDEIFYNKYHLPVFNSNAIEMNFLGIPNLAEKFVLFNDDMLILKPLNEDVFFKNDLPCDFLIQNIFKGIFAPLLYPNSLFVKGFKNSIKIINNQFNKKDSIKNNYNKYFNIKYGLKNNINNYIANLFNYYIFFEHYHHPQPYLKKTWEEVFKFYQKDILSTSSHKFRNKLDIIHYIFRYWHLVKGEFIPTFNNNFITINVTSELKARQCIEAMQNKTYVCINDSPKLTADKFDKCQKIIIKGLDKIFPNKSKFEIS